MSDELCDAFVGRAREAQIGFDAGAHREMGGAGIQESRGKCLERIVPVMVARDRVDRFRYAFEGQPELGFVVLHRADRVDDVR